jgi:hypothetical protein
MLAHDPPRILLVIADDIRRGFLATALRETGYQVVETSTEAHAADDSFDLVVASSPRSLDAAVPTLVVGEGFDVLDVEMSVLDILAWDGPPTLRRVPVWREGVGQA